jgi:hypothetical protein
VGFFKFLLGESESDPGKSRTAVPSLTAIGHEADECPYCKAPLRKPIRKRTDCHQCARTIYPRKRPIDGKVVYFRDNELDALEEQRAIASGTWDLYVQQKKRDEETRARLHDKFGREPSKNDIKWSNLNDALIADARAGHWGLYRNDKWDMAEILQSDDKTAAALVAWIEVAILDMNGPTNTGNVTEKFQQELEQLAKVLNEGPAMRPFTLEFAQLLGRNISSIRECLEALGTGEVGLANAFEEAWRRTPAKKLLPLSREGVWLKLSAAVAAK